MELQVHPETTAITYYVNGEHQTTHNHTLTVHAILMNAGFTPAEDYRLIRDNGNHTYTSFEEHVHLHEHEKFTALFQGPTPTSQGCIE